MTRMKFSISFYLSKISTAGPLYPIHNVPDRQDACTSVSTRTTSNTVTQSTISKTSEASTDLNMTKFRHSSAITKQFNIPGHY